MTSLADAAPYAVIAVGVATLLALLARAAWRAVRQ